MKSSEIAMKYNIMEYEIEKYIKEYAYFPYKENFWGELVIPDNIDIDAFFSPLLSEKAKEIEKAQQLRQEELRKQHEERVKQERLRLEAEENERKKVEEQFCTRLDHLRSQGFDGYYEYKVISLSDTSGIFKKNSGRVDVMSMTQVLNELGLDGWHLVTAYSNELGKNALSGGIGGVMTGVNSTIDENILIFERFVKI